MVKPLSPEQAQIAGRLATFRPSDRQAIATHLITLQGRRDVMRALTDYVEAWESANWLEDYSIERIGKWLAISADDPFLDELAHWSRQRRTKARKALMAGLRKGREVPPAKHGLVNQHLQTG